MNYKTLEGRREALRAVLDDANYDTDVDAAVDITQVVLSTATSIFNSTDNHKLELRDCKGATDDVEIFIDADHDEGFVEEE